MKFMFFILLVSIHSISAFCQWTGPDAKNKIYYTKGFVGVGTIPQYNLHLKTTDTSPLFFAETADSHISFTRHWIDLKARSTFTNTPYIAWHAPSGLRQAVIGWRTDGFGLTLENGFNFLIQGGNVGIGTDDTKGYQLAVAGKMIAEEVVVKLKGNWPDYVFDSTYQLPPLEDVYTFLKTNKHLPGIPSSVEVSENGINLNEMTASMLKKIEELTMYLLEERRLVLELQKKVRCLENSKEKITN